MIIILGAYEIDFKKILKYVLMSQSFILFAIITLSLLNIIPNVASYRSDNTIRYNLSFAFTTYSAILMYCITCEYLYYRERNIKYHEYIVLFLINLFIFFKTNTRFDLLCSTIIILFSLFSFI